MNKEDKIMSYISIYVLVLGLLCVVGFWMFLICFPPIAMALNNPKGVSAFAICYPVAFILLPLVIFGVYAGYQYIKGEIVEIKESKAKKKLKENYEKELDEFLKKSKGGHI